MTDWEEVPLGTLGRVVTGRTPPAASPESFGTEYPFVTPTDMDGRRYIDRAERYLSDEGAATMPRQLLPARSVMVSCIGWQLGKAAITTQDSFTNQQLNTVIPLDNSIDPKFLYYHLCTRRGEIRQLASGGTRTPILNKSRFEALLIPVPPPSTQSAVVEVLGAIDDLIENNRRRVGVLEEMARAIYREWFVHFRYPSHEDATFVDSPVGPIPSGWTIRPFSEVASFVNGFAFKPSHWSNEGRPIIKIKQLKQGVAADTPRCDETEIDEKFWVRRGALLFSWSAHLGVYRWAEEPGLLNQHLFAVVPTNGLSVDFLYHALDQAVPQFWARAQGTTMRHIKRSALTEVATVVPPLELTQEFAEAAEPMAQAVIALTQSSSDLGAIRDLLLPKLVTGQIDVSSLDLGALVEGVVA